jgi:hypothetical protein
MCLRIPLIVFVCGSMLLGAGAAGPAGDRTVRTKEPAREQADAARLAYEAAWAKFKPFDLSKGDGEDVYRWSRRWMEAERDLARGRSARAAALRRHFERMKELEGEVQMYARGTIPFQPLAATRYYRAEAERWLAEEKAK